MLREHVAHPDLAQDFASSRKAGLRSTGYGIDWRWRLTMSADASDFERAAGDAMRDFALSRSEGLAKYSTLLTRFGQGEIAAGDFSQEALKLALEEGVRYAQDSIKLGSAYLGFMSKLSQAAASSSAPARTAARKATADTTAMRARRSG